MNEYMKYQHVERLGTDEVEDILLGDCYIFPKLDGTNGHVWYDGEKVRYGSRRREIDDKDNAGFKAYCEQHEGLNALAKRMCAFTHIYGEWLVPHTVKGYAPDAWRKFYVFDMVEPKGSHLNYESLQAVCEEYGVDYIAPIRIIKNPTEEQIYKLADTCDYLMESGQIGEGVVVKNYGYTNKYGRQTWAKVVHGSFKEKHSKKEPTRMDGKEGSEDKALEFLTDEIMDKAYANILSENGSWSTKFIPQLLGVIWYDFIRECSWEIVKKLKSPTIDYRLLSKKANIKVKQHFPNIF